MNYNEIIRIAELFRCCSKYSKIHARHIQYSLCALYNNQEGSNMINYCAKMLTSSHTGPLPNNFEQTKKFLTTSYSEYQFDKNAIIYFCGIYNG